MVSFHDVSQHSGNRGGFKGNAESKFSVKQYFIILIVTVKQKSNIQLIRKAEAQDIADDYLLSNYS